MSSLIFVVFSSKRPARVPAVRLLVGETAFREVRWWVGTGDAASYRRAGALHVRESGDLCATMAFGIRTANTTEQPVVRMADDLRVLFCALGLPAHVDQPVRAAVGAARLRRAHLGGHAPGCCPSGGRLADCRSPDSAGGAGAQLPSFLHDGLHDSGPPLNFPIEFHDDVKMKCDYNVIASTLAAVGAVCRLNRFTVDAPHYRVGGASTAADRWSSDRKAARWLIRRFGAGVFRLNPRRGGGTTQVLFSGLTLLTRSALGGSVAELHTALSAAMEPTKLTRAQAQAAIGARLQLTPTQIKRSRALKPSLTKSRARRGACVRGVKRAAGRKPHGSRAMTMAERQRIARARKALCAKVRELRNL